MINEKFIKKTDLEYYEKIKDFIFKFEHDLWEY